MVNIPIPDGATMTVTIESKYRRNPDWAMHSAVHTNALQCVRLTMTPLVNADDHFPRVLLAFPCEEHGAWHAGADVYVYHTQEEIDKALME